MKLLEREFVSGDGGYSAEPLVYTQVIRSDKAAVYKRSRNGKIREFEVFKIKVLPKGTKIFSQTLEDDEERYPSNGDFGKTAWSCLLEKRAMERFHELNKVKEDKKEVQFKFPKNEFTTNELAELNQTNYITAVNELKAALSLKKVKFVKEERRASRGKMSKIYIKLKPL